MIKILIINKELSYPIFWYTAPVIPQIGEIVFGSHQGAFKIIKVIHKVSDDRNKFDNELMWVECIAEEYKEN